MSAPRETAASVEDRIASLYGEVDLAAATGVVHVTAVWPNEGDMVVMKIGDTTPKSETDFFLLNLARARADAIVVTGKILRDEPNLEYRLGGVDAAGLACWRSEVAAKTGAPRLVVLTSGRGIDLDHPALQGWAHPVFFTGPAGETALGASARRRGFSLVAHPEASVATAIEWAQRDGARTISIEAGPSTVAPLYASSSAVDEVMLSEYVSPTLARDLRAGTLMREAAFRDRFECTHEATQTGAGLPAWRFSRYVRFRPRGADPRPAARD